MPDLSASVSMSAEWGQQQPGPRLASAGLDDRQGKQPTRCLVHRVSCTLLPTVIKLASPKSNIYGSDSVISFKKNTERKFHGGPEVRTWHFHCWDTGLIPGWGTKIS